MDKNAHDEGAQQRHDRERDADDPPRPQSIDAMRANIAMLRQDLDRAANDLGRARDNEMEAEERYGTLLRELDVAEAALDAAEGNGR